MNLGTATILRANARDLPLPDNSIDLIVTSPPYFALRSYQDGGEHYDGQIGSEPTPTEFLDALLEVTAECVRVLKPSGSLFVNLGDKYVSDNRGSGGDAKRGEAKHAPAGRMGYVGEGIMPRKSLMGLPWRYAIRCIDELGLILRAEVVWSKPNGQPESVTDRVRRSHEQWFHFTREPRYFSAVDEIREPHAEVSIRRAMPHRSPAGRRDAEVYQGASGQTLALDQANHPLGKLPGSVWTVPTEPFKPPESLRIDHWAAFPTEWPKRLILGWSPSGVCTACGEGRRPVAQREANGKERTGLQARRVIGYQAVDRSDWQEQVLRTITGYVCACTPFHYEPDPNDPDRPAVLTYDWHLWTPAPTTPAVVLDPFGGTGTTAMVAKALGRHGISVDLSADYCRLAEWRTNDRDQLAKVLGIAKSDAPTQEEALF